METKKQVLFLQGGGDDGYKADLPLKQSLQKELGEVYEIHYPELKTDEDAPDFGWIKQIGTEIDNLNDDACLVAHSLGASLLLKYLSENSVNKKIAGIFLLETPFWSGDEDWKQGLKLQDNFAATLPKNLPLYFYQCRDDQEVPFAQFNVYRQKLPKATFHEFENGGHQLGGRINLVAKDIQELQSSLSK